MIPYGRQEITQDDIEEVIQVLKSDLITQGEMVPMFEAAVTEFCGSRHGVAVNSGTSALHLACLALEVGSGDLVWTSPITFVASANCARYCGAEVDFVDIDPQTFNMSPDALEEKLHQAALKNRLPKVVIPVHLCGQSCDMERIRVLGDRYGFAVIEDASHAIGGRYQNEPVGCCRYSDITVFSFHPVKIITTAEGGMAVTNRAELADKMYLLRSHAITRDPALMAGKSHGLWYYQQIGLGFNYRLTDIQAALGLSQMKRLKQFVTMRHDIANIYDQLLENVEVKTPFRSPDGYSSFHLYVVRLKMNTLEKTKKQIFADLRDAGIGVNVHYIPVYTQPYYKDMGFDCKTFPEAEKYYIEALSLPIFPALTNEQQMKVVTCLSEVLKR